MSLDDYVQVAVSMQFSEGIGKPFQPEEGDGYIIQASSNGKTYELILGQPNNLAFTGKIVMRIRNGSNLSSISCSRIAMTNQWVIDDLNQLFGEHPNTNFCPDELNSFFNWALTKYFIETKGNNPSQLPEWLMDGFVNPVPPTLKDSDFKEQLEIERKKDEEKEAIRLREETQERLRRYREEQAKQVQIQAILRATAAERQEAEKLRLAEVQHQEAEALRIKQEAEKIAEAKKEEAKAREVKVAQSKKWFILNVINNKFDKTQSFNSQYYHKFNWNDIEMLNSLFCDSSIGLETIKTWWVEYTTSKIDF
jgi:hypothetical protein